MSTETVLLSARQNGCPSYLRGKTKEEAFRIGYEMADAVTAMNPAPVKLKFEKVRAFSTC